MHHEGWKALLHFHGDNNADSAVEAKTTRKAKKRRRKRNERGTRGREETTIQVGTAKPYIETGSPGVVTTVTQISNPKRTTLIALTDIWPGTLPKIAHAIFKIRC